MSRMVGNYAYARKQHVQGWYWRGFLPPYWFGEIWWIVVPITWVGKVSSLLENAIQNPPFSATSHLLVHSW